jgi:hypothetical protein
MINGGNFGFPKKPYDKEIEKVILPMLNNDRYERPKPEALIKSFKKLKEKSDAKIKLANRMDPSSYKKPKHILPYVMQWIEAAKNDMTIEEYEVVKAKKNDPFA